MEIPEFVKEVLCRLETAGYEAWCVGGCVRDTLLGRAPQDWDVTTSALPEETMAVFGKCALPTGLQHGTVTVCAGAHRVEVTTYRRDGSYRDHRRPESVVFTPSLGEDLRRRDFTINAMALNLRGELRDDFGGQADLQKGILRCVGVPRQRFEEDALRILRGLRFAAVLRLQIERETAAAIHETRALLSVIAAERIQAEFLRLLTGDWAAEALREYPDVLGVFWPEVLKAVGFQQKNPHHCFDVWEHSLHALRAAPPEAEVRCAALLHDIGKPNCFTVDAEGIGHFYGHAALSSRLADDMLRRLKCSTEFRETVVRLVEWHDRDIPRTDRTIRRALGQLGERNFRRLLALKRADNLAQAPAFHSRQEEIDRAEELLEQLLAEDACFSLKQLAVNGHDLKGMGFTGKDIGNMLRLLLDQVVDGKLPNERGALITFASQFVTEL